MSGSEIVAEDDISEEERKLVFLSGVLDTEPDHGMAKEHSDDGQGFQKLQLVQARRRRFGISYSVCTCSFRNSGKDARLVGNRTSGFYI